MKAFTTANFSYCNFSAAACTSARIRNILDTALLAVSIVIPLTIIVLRT